MMRALWECLNFCKYSKLLGDTGVFCEYVKHDVKYTEIAGIEYVINCPFFTVKFKKLRADAQIPKYLTEGSAGFDFYAADDVIIGPGETKVVGTGLACELPFGCEMQIRPRSGLSLKTDIRMANAPGTIDSDYRGEIGIILWNVGKEVFIIEKGMRIAQGVISFVIQPKIELVDNLSATNRGSGGFGSTGLK